MFVCNSGSVLVAVCLQAVCLQQRLCPRGSLSTAVGLSSWLFIYNGGSVFVSLCNSGSVLVAVCLQHRVWVFCFCLFLFPLQQWVCFCVCLPQWVCFCFGLPQSVLFLCLSTAVGLILCLYIKVGLFLCLFIIAGSSSWLFVYNGVSVLMADCLQEPVCLGGYLS